MPGTSITATCSFEVTAWEESPYAEPDGGPVLARVTVRKRFTGALEGTSVAELLTAQSDGGRGYVASERIEGVLDGRAGSFVVQHGGLEDSTSQRTFGEVVPGSGTGELRGLRGHATFSHDAGGAQLTLTCTL